jgi:GntR family transcriptional regulator
MNKKNADIRVRKGRDPLYVVVKDKIRSLVDSGYFKPNSKLPREIELAEMLNVSRNTLREALKQAQMEGWVTQKHGVGTFISGRSTVDQGLEVFESINTMGKRRGWSTSTEDFSTETVAADSKTASALRISEGSPLYKISRVNIWDEKRVAYVEDYIPINLVNFEDLKKHFTGSVLDYIIEIGKPKIDYAWTNISAMLVGKDLADKLHVSPNEVVFLAEETMFSTDGEPIGFSLNYMLTHLFRYHIIRTLPNSHVYS